MASPVDCPFDKRFPSQLVRDDLFFMDLAFNQAIDAWRADEVPIRFFEARNDDPARSAPRPRGAQAGSLRSGRALAGQGTRSSIRQGHP